ncbi:ATP-dependent Clp protease adaptor protein ClpS [Arthrobacter crystallopoietes BAB-32]|uniref:ATP-dependent Clp protease adapter protein ClpS n=1 Tax=Arthrobacter crystallopoietes BAB-32 TaxID=1246476 RepID=N1V8U5_9MICC|nr:ATP-dependent Clp protease adapter ClpS [Arthrobacter crystallopoietes]EMY34673.1 ATP-dependent Clp protease adaptor protein ClpS [Arthrobacter crystallopoietes BAB-32]
MSSTIELLPALSPVVENTVVDVEAETERYTGTSESTATDVPWVVLVWNDPVNLMSYVSYVFQSYFGYPEAKANTLMLQVHQQGKSVVSSGTREEAERDTQAMHSFGLWATFRKADQA